MQEAGWRPPFAQILAIATAAVALFIWAPLARYRRDGLESRDSALATLYFAGVLAIRRYDERGGPDPRSTAASGASVIRASAT